jgi:Flp pilus assembly protein TadG
MGTRNLDRKNKSRRRKNRQGAVLVLAAILMFVMLAFLAFTVDTGYLASSKAEIRRSADAAAIAGCWELYDGLVQGKTVAQAQDDVAAEANVYAGLNHVANTSPTLSNSCNSHEVEIGYLESQTSGSISNNSSLPYFAVSVTVNKSTQRNGEIPFFFGRIFGDSGRALDAKATTVMARNISGFTTPGNSQETIGILPFALDLQTWQTISANTAQDSFYYNPNTGVVSSGSDGIREVNLYPQGTGSPGNRGTVDIGGANNSTADIARQIVHGISEQDILDLGKSLSFNAQGSMTLNGDTGISAGVKDELASIIGKPRIIPIFSTVTGNGNNATYTIVKWVGIRILQVKLTGAMSQKAVIIQPAPILTRNFILNESQTFTSDYVYSPVLLVR